MTFLEKIIKTKVQEVQQMKTEKVSSKRKAANFYETVKQQANTMQLIAEIKRASPSKGDIQLKVDIIAQAKSYEEAGAAAISILTDETYFKGSLADLRQVAQVVSLPILCKDFIIDEKQLVRARNAGATMVLLIVAALPSSQLRQLYQEALALELEVLVEVHNAAELKQAEALGAKLIGVNNRDLHTFTVDLSTSVALGKEQRNPETLYLSESGIRSVADVERLKKNYQAILVGEALMREVNPAIAAEKLQVQR